MIRHPWMPYVACLSAVPGAVLLDEAELAAWLLLGVIVLGCLAAAVQPWTTIKAGTIALTAWFVAAVGMLSGESLGYALFALAAATAAQAFAWLVGAWIYGMRATSPR